MPEPRASRGYRRGAESTARLRLRRCAPQSLSGTLAQARRRLSRLERAPVSPRACALGKRAGARKDRNPIARAQAWRRSEEHTSELQSPCNLVCRLLLEKKNKTHDPPRLNNPGSDSDYFSTSCIQSRYRCLSYLIAPCRRNHSLARLYAARPRAV